VIRFSIRRPVTVAMVYLALAVLGVASWNNIPVELYPDTELPRLTVTGDWPGASPETVEAFLTSPIESEIQKIEGVEKVTSESYHEMGRGRSRIEVEFARGADMDFVRLDLSERIAALEDQLPAGAGRVRVEPYVPREFQEQERPFMRYTFTGPHTDEALRRHLDDEVEPELSRVTGVALMESYGGRDRLVEVELDEDRINALGLSAVEVGELVEGLDLVREAGAVRSGDLEWAVTIQNRPASVQEIRDAVLTVSGGRLIRIADVADVRDTFEEATRYYRINGRPAVQFTLAKQIRSNTVRVAGRVRDAVALVQRRTLPGARFILDEDQSEQIERQLTDLRYRALVAAVVIFGVLLLFLGSFRSAGVVFATIAFSVLIALNLVYFGGLTLNLLTLMGLAMGFGLIVDNSIVVLENVYRRWQGGEEGVTAAEDGARQVVLPILASTATTLIVFVPFVYLQGDLRIFYVPLAVVVGLTLVASLFVAFSFIPAAAARLLGRNDEASSEGGDRTAWEHSALYVRFYSAVVGWTLTHPWATVVVAVLAFGGSWYLFDSNVTRGVVWGGVWGQDTYISVQIRLPRGSDLERSDELTRYFEDRLAGMPEVEQFVASVQESFALLRVTFPDELENTDVPVAIKEQLLAYSLGYSGAEVRVFGYGPSFYGGGSTPPNYAVTVLGYNYERVREIAEDIGSRLRRLSRVSDVDTNASGMWFQDDRATEFVVTLRRSALARYDLTVEDFVRRMNAAVRGQTRDATLKIRGEEVRFEVKLADARRMDVLELQETLITGPEGTVIRVGDVVTVEPAELLARIRREDQQYERRVTYEFRGPRRLGDAFYDAVVGATELPPGYTVRESDENRLSDEDRRQIFLLLAVSVALIYMVTSALFESLRQPLCVLLTVPMALIGVFLMFFYTNASFTREAYVGVIMMGGIVVNNAILLVDHINQVRRETSLELRAAILRGTLERVRPILMTTTTTVLGLLPLVLFSASADANIWNALAFALIGGLLSSTVFVLTTTPALYLLFERRAAAEATGRIADPGPTPSQVAQPA
jgi:HAE1 family hydrophobic/amphiphilic exporter-1